MSETENTTSAPTRRQHVTREEEADRSLNHTGFSKGTMALMTGLFLLTIFGVPVVQHVVEIRRNLAKRAEWRPDSGQPQPGIAPRVYEVGSLLPTGEQVRKAKGFWGYWSLIPSSESIVAFEDSLKEQSVLTQALLSPAQEFMSGRLGVGNEKAYLGEPGWLFYRPDVEYLTSAGFLTAHRLRERSHGFSEIQPDPLKAILDTKAQLEKRGITLIVMPVPTKPMIQPEKLIGGRGAGLRPQNHSYAEFVSRLEAQGVPVFDAEKILIERRAAGPQYLETDTHWTPTAMDAVAGELAKFVAEKGGLASSPAAGYTEKTEAISHLGDIAEMLKLPKDQRIFSPQRVDTRRVYEASGEPWQVRPEADVLLLGDSFSNIFSLGGMGWGEGAGLAERLSYAMQRPVDKIVINAGGAFSSRQDLMIRMQRGSDRLAGKKVVILEFSMRDLAQGDWKMITFPAATGGTTDGTTGGTSGGTTGTTKPPVGDLEVTGRVAARAATPAPGSVPYKDCVIALHLTDLKVSGGNVSGKDIVVYVWGMKDNVLVDGDYGVGKTVTLRLTPWAKAEATYGGYNRQELDDMASFDWDAFWGVKK